MDHSSTNSNPPGASRLTLILPDDAYAIRIYRHGGDDIDIKFSREIRGDGKSFFLRPDGTVIPNEVGATIDLIRELQEQQAFYVSPDKMPEATALAQKLYVEKIEKAEKAQHAGLPEQQVKKQTVAKEALTTVCGRLPRTVLNRCADIIRKKL